ncbi:MAG: hypothetical protein U0793_12500 [Gemmataceae bacterium]
MVRAFGAGLILMVAVGASGCGSGKKEVATYDVTGKVEYNGKPMEEGMIIFDLADGIPPATGDIKGGTYSVKARTGKAKVSISWQKLIPGKKGPMDTEVRDEMVAPEYNAATKLTAEIKEGPNNFDFKVTGKK